jgi:flagellar protein FliL
VAGEKHAAAPVSTPPPEKDAAQATPGKKLPLPAVIAIYVVAVLAAAAFVQRVLVPWADAAATPPHNAAAVSTVNKATEPERAAAGAEGGGNVYVVDDLVVNPAESGGLRYVAASVGLRSARPTFLEDMKTREAPIKDALIRILGSKTVDQLADIRCREAMRAEILTEVDRLIPDQQVDAVYFTRFVLQ